MPPQKRGLRFRAREMRKDREPGRRQAGLAWRSSPPNPAQANDASFRVDPGLHIVAIEGNLLGERANGCGRSDAQGLGREVEMSGDGSV